MRFDGSWLARVCMSVFSTLMFFMGFDEVEQDLKVKRQRKYEFFIYARLGFNI